MSARLRLLLRLAWRNVRRQARRSLLTASAMVLGLALLVFSRTLADGAHEDWIEQGVRMGSGHVSIQHPAFRTRRTIGNRLDKAAVEDARRALARPDIARYVKAVAPRVNIDALASSPTSAIPVSVIAVDPAAERTFSTLPDKLAEGRYLEPDDRLAGYVGVGLLRRLGLSLGSRLVLTAQDATGEISGQLVRIVGTFRAGIPEVDDGMVHIPLATAQQWLGIDGDVSQLAVLLESSFVVGHVTARLQPALADRAATVSVLGWRQAQPELDAAVRIDDAGDYVFHAILLAIVALAIVNTILVSVLYRTREFGILRALGMTRGQSAALVFFEGVFLTLASGIVGMAVGLAVTWVFFRHGLDLSFVMDQNMTGAGVVMSPVMVPMFRVQQLVQSLSFILLIGIVASLYPAFRATRIVVAEAMKFDA